VASLQTCYNYDKTDLYKKEAPEGAPISLTSGTAVYWMSELLCFPDIPIENLSALEQSIIK
jgi:hypothetical protein